MRAGFLTTIFLCSAVALAAPAYASVEISAKPTHDMNCAGGVCTPTAKNANLNTTYLANKLTMGDMKVVTGNGAVTITVTAPFSWTSTHRLTLDAYYNVSFKAPVVVAGQGAITIVTNDGGTGGDLIFFDGGKLDFWDTSSNLVINGNAYILVNDISTLIVDVSNDASGFYALAQDYNASVDGQYAGSPISTFLGMFDGLGHHIIGLSVHSADYVQGFLALFAQSSGEISNIGLDDFSITVDSNINGWSVGSLVGTNYGEVKYASADNGTITETTNVDGAFGGLVGTNLGKINASDTIVNVTGVYSGGLVGVNEGLISDSRAAGAVNGMAGAGGLTAVNYAQVARCQSGGTVSAHRAKNDNTHNYVGGLVGWNQEGHISQSFSTSKTTGFNRAVLGGLVGWNRRGTVLQAYALGDATSKKSGNIGGFVGLNDNGSRVVEAFSIGLVSGGTNAVVGGTVGRDLAKAGHFDFAYWDLDTSGINNPSQGAGSPANDPGITGLTDAQLKSGLPTGFDPAIWAIKKNINNGYPYLIANPPPQ